MQQEGRPVGRIIDVLQQSGEVKPLRLAVEVAVLVHFQAAVTYRNAYTFDYRCLLV